MTTDHLRLSGDEWSKSEIEKNVKVIHVLFILLINSFGMGLAFPCCGFHESGIPVQDVVSDFLIVHKVSDFAIFNFYLCSFCKIHLKWSCGKEVLFALG